MHYYNLHVITGRRVITPLYVDYKIRVERVNNCPWMLTAHYQWLFPVHSIGIESTGSLATAPAYFVFFFFPLHITSCSRHYYNRLSLILIFDAGTKIFRVDEENFHGFLDQKSTQILNIWRVILRKILELEFSSDMKISSRHFIGYFGCHNESIHSLSNEKSPLLSVTYVLFILSFLPTSNNVDSCKSPVM